MRKLLLEKKIFFSFDSNELTEVVKKVFENNPQALVILKRGKAMLYNF
jgi:Asp-tRNA(Asn)/Glu-tRNA(Gln) amidotransferase B subunit